MTVTKFASPGLAPLAALLEAVRTDLMGLGLGVYTLMVRQDPKLLRELGMSVEFSSNALSALAETLPRQERRPLIMRAQDLQTVRINILAAVHKLEVQ